MKLRNDKQHFFSGLLSYFNKVGSKIKTSFYDGITRIFKNHTLLAAQAKYRTTKKRARIYEFRIKRTQLDQLISRQYMESIKPEKKRRFGVRNTGNRLQCITMKKKRFCMVNRSS